MGFANSRSAACLSWLLMSLALLNVQAQYSRYARRGRGYHGRRIGQPRSLVEAPLPRLPLPVPISLLSGGARLVFPPPPKEFAHASFLPTSEPLDGTSGVIKIQFSKVEDEDSSAVEVKSLDQEKKIVDIETTTTATKPTTKSGQQSHFVVQNVILPLETKPLSNIPKALEPLPIISNPLGPLSNIPKALGPLSNIPKAQEPLPNIPKALESLSNIPHDSEPFSNSPKDLDSNFGPLLDVEGFTNSIPELTTFASDEEILIVKQNESVPLNSESPRKRKPVVLTPESPKALEANTLLANVSDISMKFNIPLDAETKTKSEIFVITQNISDVISKISPTEASRPLSVLSDVVKVDPINSNTLEVLPLFSENHDSPHQELLRLPSSEIEPESESIHKNLLRDTNVESLKKADPLPSIIKSISNPFENVDAPVTDSELDEFNEVNEKETSATLSSIPSIVSTTIEPQPFKRSNLLDEFQPIWVTHDFVRKNKGPLKQSLSSVSHQTRRNPIWH